MMFVSIGNLMIKVNNYNYKISVDPTCNDMHLDGFT